MLVGAKTISFSHTLLLLGIVVVGMILAGIVVIVGRARVGGGTSSPDSGGSVIRSWIAISLVMGLLIFYAAAPRVPCDREKPPPRRRHRGKDPWRAPETQALRAWADRHRRAPRVRDWEHATREHPNNTTAIYRFGRVCQQGRPAHAGACRPPQGARRTWQLRRRTSRALHAANAGPRFAGLSWLTGFVLRMP
jgi:hypothetical protein